MKRLLLTLFLLLSLTATAASQLDAVRANASHARELTNQVRSEQAGKRSELNTLAQRIEVLKQNARGKLLPGSELDSALKQSQELSAQLTTLASSMAAREGELESANLALLTELSSELTRLRAEFDRQTDRNTRKALIESMRKLRAEREQVRAMLPAARVPALEAVRPSDDPEDLLEQADALKDNEDKVRAQLQSLEKRIAEARAEKELDGRVRQFLGEEALFDDQDRRLRVRRETVDSAAPAPTTRLSAGETRTGGTAEFGAQNDTAKTGSPTPLGGFGAPPPQSPGAGAPNDATAGGANPTSPGTPSVREVQGNDARPQVGGHRIAGSDDDDLEDLEIQRNRLKGLAEELRSRAAGLQKKAAELK